MNMLDHALRYASQGLPVFPVHTTASGVCSCGAREKCSPGKHPASGKGFKEATTDSSQIREWWTTNPDYNIGIPSGPVSGFFVMDLDVTKGKDGTEEWGKLQDAQDPQGLVGEGDPQVITSGSGGVHLLYAFSPGVTNSKGAILANGIDVRGAGGYIVAPPSLHPCGKRYSGDIDGTKLKAAPDWLLKLVRRQVMPDAPPVVLEGSYVPTRTDLEHFAAKKIKFDNGKAVARVAVSLVAGTVWAPKGERYQDMMRFLGAFRMYILDAHKAPMDPEGACALFAASLAATAALPDCETPTTREWLLSKLADLSRDDSVYRGKLEALRAAKAESQKSADRLLDAYKDPDAALAVREEQRTPLSGLVPVARSEKKLFNTVPLQPNGTLDEVIALLKDERSLFSDNTNKLARVIRVKDDENTEPVVIEPVAAEWLQPLMSDIADWYKPTKDYPFKPASASKEIAQMLLARRDYPGVRDIRGVALSPFFRQDGTLCATEGYDAKSGMWLSLSGLKLPPIPEHPTHADAVAAAGVLKDLLRDFMFEDPNMSSIWLSLVLTPLARPRHSPVHLADAANPGTGKGLFCESAMQIAIGRKMTKPWPEGETERGKMIVASAVKGSPVFWLDNISPEMMLDGGAFEGAVTDGSTGRVLGASLDSPPILRTTFIANGNNVRMSPDVMRRTLRCVIIADTANPAARPASSFFYPELKNHIVANRPKYLATALTLLRAYYAAGKPKQVTQSISFQDWSQDVASAIVWAGEPDPAQFLASLGQEVDEKTEALSTLLAAIDAMCKAGDGTMRAGQLCSLTPSDKDHEPILDAMNILGVNKTPIDSAQVGRLLTKIRGTVVRLRDGREVRLLKTETASNNKTYWVGPPPTKNKVNQTRA